MSLNQQRHGLRTDRMRTEPGVRAQLAAANRAHIALARGPDDPAGVNYSSPTVRLQYFTILVS